MGTGSAWLADVTTTYGALPSFDGFKDSVISILGSLVMIILVVRMVTAYGKRNYGEMVGEFIAVIVIGWFVWFPDSAQTTVKEIASSIFG